MSQLLPDTTHQQQLAPQSFPNFPRLPPEIRNQIWYDAIPGPRPALSFYRQGHWNRRRLGQGDERHAVFANDPEQLAREWVIEYSTSQFRGMELRDASSVANACREARGIALGWAEIEDVLVMRHGQGEGVDGEGQGWVTFEVEFDIDCDAVYVAPEMWETFMRMERNELVDEIDEENRGRVAGIEIRPGLKGGSLAVARAGVELLGEAVLSWGISQLLVVVDAPDEFERDVREDAGGDMHRCWEFEPVPRVLARFDHPKNDFVCEYPDDQASDRYKGLLDDLVLRLDRMKIYLRIPTVHGLRPFEIRPVTVHRG